MQQLLEYSKGFAFKIDGVYVYTIQIFPSGIIKVTLKDIVKYTTVYEFRKMIFLYNEKSNKLKETLLSLFNRAQNMSWLTDELHEQLVNHECWRVRQLIAEYSDKYHHKLKDDEDSNVRLSVIKYSDRFHEYLSKDEEFIIRYSIVKQSPHLASLFLNDEDPFIQHIASTILRKERAQNNSSYLKGFAFYLVDGRDDHIFTLEIKDFVTEEFIELIEHTSEKEEKLMFPRKKLENILKNLPFKKRLIYKELYNRAQDWSWLTNKLREKLIYFNNWRIPFFIVRYSDTYRYQQLSNYLVYCKHEYVAKLIAENSIEYHEYLSTLSLFHARFIIAKVGSEELAKKLLNSTAFTQITDEAFDNIRRAYEIRIKSRPLYKKFLDHFLHVSSSINLQIPLLFA